MEITINIFQLLASILVILVAIWSADKLLGKVENSLDKKIEKEKDRHKQLNDERRDTILRNVMGHAQAIEDRRYEIEVLNLKADGIFTLTKHKDEDGFFVPPSSCFKYPTKPFKVYNEKVSKYFGENEEANKRNTEQYIESRLKGLREQLDSLEEE